MKKKQAASKRRVRYCQKCISTGEGNKVPANKKCKYCGEYFCNRHVHPEGGTKQDNALGIISTGHHCIKYREAKLLSEKRHAEKRSSSLHEILSRSDEVITEGGVELGFKLPTSSKVKDEEYEMYIPGRKKHHSHHYSLRRHLDFKKFLRRYVYFRIQDDIKPHLNQLGILCIIGLLLNYVYYQTFSLSYLFIGGVNEWFRVLIPTLNYGIGGYNLVYLSVNGIFYIYFYYSLVLAIYNTIINLNEKDIWIMIGWFALIFWMLLKIFPQII